MADRKGRGAYSRNMGEKHWGNDKFKRNSGQQSHKSKIKALQEKRQRMAIRHYKHTLKQEKKQLATNSEGQSDNQMKQIERLDKKIKMSSFQRAQEIYERKQEEIQERREEKARILKEKEEARAKYREIKMKKMRILRQKTRKGQPLMKGRIELLLEEIEKKVNHNN